jgi:hypothetical protein
VPFKDYAPIGAAGEINSSVRDLATWVQLFLDKGLTSNGDVLIGRDQLEELCAAFIDTDLPGISYGLGWYRGNLLGKPYLFHDGIADGFSSLVSFMPEEKLGVIVLCNQNSDFATADLKDWWLLKAAADIYDYLLNGAITGRTVLPAFPAAAGLLQLPISEAVREAMPATDPAPADVAGIYSDPGFGEFTIDKMGADWAVSYFGHTWPAKIVGNDIFFLVYAAGSRRPLKGTLKKNIFGTAVTGLEMKLTRERDASTVIFKKR